MPTVRVKTVEVVKLTDYNEFVNHGKCSIELIEGKGSYEIYENQNIVIKQDGAKFHATVKGNKLVKTKPYSPLNIKPQNSEQEFLLNMLRDKNIKLKIISGVAGSGKTFCVVAHALNSIQSHKSNINKIVFAKSPTPLFRSLGLLPGTIDEKLKVWLGAFYDNAKNLGIPDYEIDALVDPEENESGQMLEFVSIEHLQGRSLDKTMLIVDEFQQLPLDVLKQIITRAGEDSEVILLGDPAQIFERGKDTEDFMCLINKAKASELIAHIDLHKGIRSPLADWANNNL